MSKNFKATKTQSPFFCMRGSPSMAEATESWIPALLGNPGTLTRRCQALGVCIYCCVSFVAGHLQSCRHFLQLWLSQGPCPLHLPCGVGFEDTGTICLRVVHVEVFWPAGIPATPALKAPYQSPSTQICHGYNSQP